MQNVTLEAWRFYLAMLASELTYQTAREFLAVETISRNAFALTYGRN